MPTPRFCTLAITAVLALSGCSAMRVYTMTIPALKAGSTIPLLLDAAKAPNKEARSAPTMLQVTYDDATTLTWGVAPETGNFQLYIEVSHSVGDDAARKARLDEAKKFADDLWEEAVVKNGGPPAPKTPVAERG